MDFHGFGDLLKRNPLYNLITTVEMVYMQSNDIHVPHVLSTIF